MTAKSLTPIKKAYRFSVAPMMDCTDRHFRVLMRQISSRALLYTEMIVAQTLKHSDHLQRILDFDPIEHPIALQIGGDDPELLANAARIAAAWGYDEINFNVGCPSPRVNSGNFGACLMANPDQVARCIEAIRKATPLDVTIKHRLGIDNLDNNNLLIRFVDRVAAAGAKRFTIHARKAWLNGLNPKENRTIPPLQYERVAYLKEQRPNLIIELNGGIQTPNDCLEALKTFDGVMVGRAAYKDPLRWKTIDELIYGEKPKLITPSKIIKELIPHAQKHLNEDGKLWDLCRHLLPLVQGTPGARLWRKSISAKAQNKNADLKILEEAIKELEDKGL